MHPTNALLTLACAGAILTTDAIAADYNGDGFADLAIGCRLDPVNGVAGAGSVTILYGDASAFATITSQTLTQASFGSLVTPQELDRFGFKVGSGDFNGDGFDDLAITSYGETVSGKLYAGTVLVAYGSALGIQTSTAQVFHQDSPGVKDKIEKHPTLAGASADNFGTALAAGDFDGDGFDDLAIGVYETLGTKKKPKDRAGGVHVLRGGLDGLSAAGDQFITRETKGIPGKSKAGGFFGYALVAGDLDGDGVDDLVIGEIDNLGHDGSVLILRGKLGKGLSAKGAVVIDETTAGGTPDLAFGNQFGNALAIGDFTGTGVPQLVVSAYASFTGANQIAGAVYVLSLSQPDLAVVASKRIARGDPNVEGPSEAYAYFGNALAVGDFNADGIDDLVISANNDTVAGIASAGSMNVFLGSITGISTEDHYVTQSTPLVAGSAEFGDQFGIALAAADFDADGDSDLAIGIHGQTVGALETCGAVLIFEGSSFSIFDYGSSRVIDKSHPSIEGDPVEGTYFAASLGG